MIAPLMTCSARLPVYALIIGAFIPQRSRSASFNLQGLVLFALYVAGIARRDGRRLGAQAHRAARGRYQPLMLELPTYRWPQPAQSRARPVGARDDLPRAASAPSSSR